MKILWFEHEEGGMQMGTIKPSADEVRRLFDHPYARQHTRSAVRWATSEKRKVGQFKTFGIFVLVTVLSNHHDKFITP